jgi:hypothetical protein
MESISDIRIVHDTENINLEQNTCLICLEVCDNFINFECCGKYKIHSVCYKKWNETNKTCLICRNQVSNDTNPFIIYYVTLFRLKLLIYIYIVLFFTFCLSIVIMCDLKDPYCF